MKEPKYLPSQLERIFGYSEENPRASRDEVLHRVEVQILVTIGSDMFGIAGIEFHILPLLALSSVVVALCVSL